MGQYYYGCLISPKRKNHKTTDYRSQSNVWLIRNTKVIIPCGLKLLEHSYLGILPMLALENELKKHSRIVVWSGDYADKLPKKDKNLHDILDESMFSKNFVEELKTNKMVIKITKTLRNVKSPRFFINLDKNEFIDIEKVKPCTGSVWSCDEGILLHPIPLLCADGCFRGGGDYPKEGANSNLIGSWAWNRIKATNIQPNSNKFTEITPNFDI